MTVIAGNLTLARGAFDVGLLTNHGEDMLRFWSDELGFPVESTLDPTPGVVQHKLSMCGAVLKLNCLQSPFAGPLRVGGIRILLLVDPSRAHPEHRRDPDGNLVCLVPPGYRGIRSFGVHLAVSDEQASRHFYGDVLGLPSVEHNIYDCAGATISLAWSPDVEPGVPTSSAGFGYVTFQVLDTIASHAELCARGAKELTAPGESGIATTATISFVADPDGNRIEISQRPDLVAAATRDLVSEQEGAT